MFNALKNSKVITGLVVVVAAGAILYYWSGSSPTPTVTSAADTQVGSQELLLTLGSLNTIRLDPALFSNPGFTALSDFGVVIPPQPAGRRNPFAPVGSGSR